LRDPIEIFSRRISKKKRKGGRNIHCGNSHGEKRRIPGDRRITGKERGSGSGILKEKRYAGQRET